VPLRASGLALGQLGVVMTYQSVSILLPTIGIAMSADPAQLQWLVAATALTYAGGLPIAGSLADRYGGPRLLIIGSLVMAGSCLAAAVSPHFAVLVAARIGQGLGMALYTPAMLSLLKTGFDREDDRHRAMVWWNVAGGAGGLVGLIGGGGVAQVSWRAAFLLLAVAPLATAILTRIAFRRRRATTNACLRQVDTLSAILLPAAATFAVLGFTLLQQGSTVGAASLAVGAGILLAWLWRERSTPRPLVPVSLRRWAALQPVVLAVLHAIAINTPIFFYALFLQSFRQATPWLVALGYIPANIGLIVGSWIGGQIGRRRSLRAATMAGFALIVVSELLLMTVNPDSTMWDPFFLAWLIFGLGAAMAQVGFLGTANRESGDDAGTLAGLLTAGGQLGTATGLALLTGVAALAPGEISGYRLAFAGSAVAALIAVIVARAGRQQPRG
jgi:MFS family permease